ncbi:uncharacterized protein LOC141764158 [Sebastes fasciatus]|uniref:uncharacterized protein LOC141764158 n=1 Tax=Sebastes fasciatus TaxID=394691 RepID=UPI003D9F8B3B
MGHQDKEMDAESLQKKSSGRRLSCLDVFLVVSVLFLFVSLSAVAVGGLLAVMELRAKLEPLTHPHVHPKASRMTGDTPDPAYKMQNFAYLEAKSSELKTSTMHWDAVDYATGTSVGSNFLFDAEQHLLKAKQFGIYFIYIDLNLTCTGTCDAGLLIVRLDDKLTCEVELPEMADITPVSRKCWTVSRLEGQKLLTQMTVPENGLTDWKLELKGSGLGMFLVD